MIRNYFVLVLILVLFTPNLLSQIVNIPDPDFKNALVNSNCVDVNNDGIVDSDADLNNDGEIQVSEAEAVVWLLDVSDRHISSLEGIASFSNLRVLVCGDNNLAGIDLSSNESLTRLYCKDNQITSLDVSGLTNLDRLSCPRNQLTSLDLSQNLLLEELNCEDNSIADLVLPATSTFRKLFCNNNVLTTLDVSQVPNIWWLYCHDNLISTIDISQNPFVGYFDANSNRLLNLNIQNGTNNGIGLMYAYFNPDLLCIQVDDVNNVRDCEPGGGGWCVDPWAEYSEKCELGVDDLDFDAVSFYPNPVRAELRISADMPIEKVSILNAMGQLVSTYIIDKLEATLDLSGISTGVYFLEVELAGESLIKRVVKQ